MIVTGMSLDTASIVRSITTSANVDDPKFSDTSKIIKSDLDEMRRQFALDMNAKRRDQGNLEPRLVTPDELVNIAKGLKSTVASEEPKKDIPLSASGFDFASIADIATKAVPMLGGISSLIGNTVDLFRKPEKTETPKEVLSLNLLRISKIECSTLVISSAKFKLIGFSNKSNNVPSPSGVVPHLISISKT